MKDKARKLIEKYEELESELGNPDVLADQARYNKIHKQYKGIEKAVAKAKEYLQMLSDQEEWKMALGDSDPEMVAMAKSELSTIEKALPELTDELQYCSRMGWKMTIQDASEGTVGGYKEIRVFIEGDSVYGTLKFESGVHRVQRVPETETQGRVHTSAATVAILPEAEEVDVEIREADIHMDTYRSSGAGGQYINKTDSAVRLTHIPTGVVVSCQTERSQLQNRLHAMEMLRSKILDALIAKKEQEEAASRKALVGTGDRSAKIRTYNFPQNRVTDHRIGLTLYNLDKVITGDLDEIINGLQMANAQEKLGKFNA